MQDIDNDTDVDVVTSCVGGGACKVAWYENNGASPPGWTERIIAYVSTGWSVFAIDLDNDTDIDVLTTNSGGYKVLWYENNGSAPPGWTTRDITSTPNPLSVYAADLDNDTDIDVLSADSTEDRLYWYENDGNSPPGWTNRIISTSADGALDVFAIDLDGDSDSDVLSASRYDDKIAWYENSGDISQVLSVRVAQVVENVDLVKDKKTLVRSEINGSANSSTTVKLFFNDVQKNSTDVTFNETGGVNVTDLFFIPDTSGNNLEIKIETSDNEFNIKLVDVIETRGLTLSFTPVDGPTTFEDFSLDSLEFIDKIYPLADNGIISKLNHTNIQSTVNERTNSGIENLMNRIYKSTLIAGELPERAVGVLPLNWFEDNLGRNGTRGYAKGSNGVLVERDLLDIFDHVSAHELAHTYGLCDENNETVWNDQDSFFFEIFKNKCPNGDSDDNNELDPICIPNGCPTFTLEPLSGRPDNTLLNNFMGSDITDNAWISNESYEHLLEEFSHSTPISVESRAVISGKVNKSAGTAIFDNFYTICAGLAENESDHIEGNYSIQVFDDFNNLLYNISFDVSFLNIFFNGTTEETNKTAFAFTIPFNETAFSIILKENSVTKDTRNTSDNIPTIDLNTNLGGQTFNNELFNISWNSSDADSDEIKFAILISPDNGTSYSTLEIDYNLTNITLNSSSFLGSSNYVIKVLATDGINTNSSISDTFTILPDDAYKLYIKNNTGGKVAWFGSEGNILLKGTCTNETICAAPANSFTLGNSTDDTASYIDPQGNLCIEKGDCSDSSSSCNPIRNAFIISDLANINRSYIDFSGDMCLTGSLYEDVGTVL